MAFLSATTALLAISTFLLPAPAASKALRRPARPFFLTYDPRTTAPSAMMSAEGILTTLGNCVILQERNTVRFLIWREPTTLRKQRNGYVVRHMGRVARFGQRIQLTGTLGGPVAPSYARENKMPNRCASLNSMMVNGILLQQP